MTHTTQTRVVEAVRLRAARKVYGTGDQAVTALDGITIGFRPGTFTAIMGPSGSGKSTLLQCAAGLDQLTSGEVVVGGVDIGPLTERRRTMLRRERIGFMFQSYNLMASLTAAQNVELPLRLAGRRPSPDAVAAALAEVGLAERASHRPSELSGGQQQRVALARALVTEPQVMFADEPTGALDTVSSREVLGLLREAVRRRGQTVVMVTHDPIAASYAHSVVFLKDGRIADQLDLHQDGQLDLRRAAEDISARMTRIEA